jgi:hypothetical protein
VVVVSYNHVNNAEEVSIAGNSNQHVDICPWKQGENDFQVDRFPQHIDAWILEGNSQGGYSPQHQEMEGGFVLQEEFPFALVICGRGIFSLLS